METALIRSAILAGFFAMLKLNAAEPDSVLAAFEDPTYGTWKTTGTAFGSGPARGAPQSNAGHRFLRQGSGQQLQWWRWQHRHTDVAGVQDQPEFHLTR